MPWQPCHAADVFVMDKIVLTALCAAQPSLCTHLGSLPWMPSAHPAKEALHKALWLAASARNSTFLRTGLCTTISGQCGGKFLHCPGVDPFAPPELLGTYDEAADLLGIQCQRRGCDGFTSGRDGGGGTLFKYARNNASALYLRLNATG